MDTQELKVIMNSLYGFTATQLVQQVSAINALERTLEDIKKGASWQSLDLCLDSAISTLETIKNTPGINSERSEKCIFPISIEKFNQMLDNNSSHPYEDLIVTIKYKYDWETDYIIENQLLEYDGNVDNYIWLHDWDEGQTDVTVLGFIPVSEVSTNSERSEKPTTLNIDYIRSLSVEDLAIKIKNCIYICEEGECAKCPFDNNDYGCTLQGIKEWLVSERSEKEENDE